MPLTARVLGRLIAAFAAVRAVIEAVGWFELQRVRLERRRLVAARHAKAGQQAVREMSATNQRGVRLGTWITTGLAVGAVGLYAIGSVRTAGRLQASDVSISDTFSVVPLENHITNGLGVVLSGTSLLVVVLLGFVVLRIASETWTVDERRQSMRRRPRWRQWLALWPNVLVVVALLVAAPWWATPGVVLVWGSEVLGYQLTRRGPDAWRGHPIATRVSVFFGTFVFFTFASGYWLADPLPKATLTLTDSGTATGVLVADANGEFVLGDPGSRVLYRAWPHDQVRNAAVTKQEREEERSIPDLLGIDLGLPERRTDDDEGSSDTERSPGPP